MVGKSDWKCNIGWFLKSSNGAEYYNIIYNVRSKEEKVDSLESIDESRGRIEF